MPENDGLRLWLLATVGVGGAGVDVDGANDVGDDDVDDAVAGDGVDELIDDAAVDGCDDDSDEDFEIHKLLGASAIDHGSCNNFVFAVYMQSPLLQLPQLLDYSQMTYLLSYLWCHMLVYLIEIVVV